MRLALLIGGLLLSALVILWATLGSNWFRSCDDSWPGLCDDESVTEDNAAAPEVARFPSADPSVPPTPPMPAAGVRQVAPVIEPPLDISDEALRTELSRIQPPASWLELDALMERSATLLVSLADGFVPRKVLGPVRPSGGVEATPISTRPDEPRYRLTLDGGSRFEPVFDVLLALPPEAVAELVLRYEPALKEALKQLGDARSVLELLRGILIQLRDVPTLAARPLVTRPGLRYEFVDPALEDLSDLQKTALRLGPEQRSRLIAYGESVLGVISSSTRGAAE